MIFRQNNRNKQPRNPDPCLIEFFQASNPRKLRFGFQKGIEKLRPYEALQLIDVIQGITSQWEENHSRQTSD